MGLEFKIQRLSILSAIFMMVEMFQSVYLEIEATSLAEAAFQRHMRDLRIRRMVSPCFVGFTGHNMIMVKFILFMVFTLLGLKHLGDLDSIQYFGIPTDLHPDGL